MSEIEAWLRLQKTPGVGPVAFGKLLQHFGSPAAALDAPRSQWAQAGLNARQLKSAAAEQSGIEADLEWLQQPGHHVITLLDPAYPTLLRDIPDPPPLLYVIGDVSLLQHPQLAIVGSRNATRSGEQTTRAFAAHLAAAGLGITSGLASGVDAAAHRGALDANGITIAVAGTGLDRVYPAKNRELAREIGNCGAIISEFAIGTRPATENFPRRNRIIAGLSLGTLVVEAARQSGSLITARFASEQGREVFAIPGSIHNPLARGCHQLIRQGAKLVETAEDILEELASLITIDSAPPEAQQTQLAKLDEEHQTVLAAIDYDPTPVDMIITRSGFSAQEVASMLLIMELEGRVMSEPGGYYTRLTPEGH